MDPRAHHVLPRLSRRLPLSVAVLVVLAGCWREPSHASGSHTFTVEEDGILRATLHDGVSKGFALAAAPAHGTVSLGATTGAIVYVPAPNFHGEDSFTYREALESGAFEAAVAVNVVSVDDPPVASAGAAELDEDGVFDGQLVATDADGDRLTFEIVDPPRRGRVTVDPVAGTYRYLPAPNYDGPDSFQFVARDAMSASEPAAIAITVRPVNDAPVAVAQRTFVGASAELQGMLWAEDPEGDPVTYAVARPPEHGALSLSPDGTVFAYRPDAGFTGADSFDFTASDGAASSAPATVAFDVRAAGPFGPQVQLQQGRTTVAVGESAVLGVTASGVSPLRFVWRRNGVRIMGAAGARYVSPPLTRADHGAKYAVTVHGTPTSMTSLSWVVNVVERRPGREVITLHDDRAELYPTRDPVGVASIVPLADGIGARVTLAVPSGQFPSLSVSGDAAVTGRTTDGVIDVAFEDAGQPQVQTARVSLAPPDGSGARTLALSYANAAWFTSLGSAAPARVTFTELDLPAVSSRVEEWVVRPATTAEIAFAQATWGAVVAAGTTPTERARALAAALIDELEPHRGIPSDGMRVAPFEQYRRAMQGVDEVWCANIAAIFTLACNALGIPARIAGLGRTVSLGAEYKLQTAESHSTTEIFDAQRNAWSWIDPTMYLLGIEEPGVGPLDASDMQRAINDPTRVPVLTALEYDVRTRTTMALPPTSSSQWQDLGRFFGADTLLGAPRLGRDLTQELHTNVDELFPRNEDLALRDLKPLPDGIGVELRLTSALPDLTEFQLRQTYTSWGAPDAQPQVSKDGRFVVAFPDPHQPVAKAVQFTVKAVGASGRSSAEPTLTLFLYPTEFYAANGLTTLGVVIFTRGALPVARSVPQDWLVEEPTLADRKFARALWGVLGGEAGATERAAAVAAAIRREVGGRQGIPSSAVEADPLAHYRSVAAGQDAVDSLSLARILARACSALGIPARVVEMGRVLGSGTGYALLGAEPRGAIEVFDAQANRWAFIDPSTGVLGAELEGYGFLNSTELQRALESPAQVARLRLLTADAGSEPVVRVPAESSVAADTLRAYFRTRPAFSFARRAW